MPKRYLKCLRRATLNVFFMLCACWLASCAAAPTVVEPADAVEEEVVLETVDNEPAYHVSLRAALPETAREYLGVRYKFGGTSADTGFDCSGFTITVYEQFGIDLPRTAREQFKFGKPVDKENLQAGDLVFFDTLRKGYVTHVGIYIGDGMFIHAARKSSQIQESYLDSAYFQKCYLGARTYLFMETHATERRLQRRILPELPVLVSYPFAPKRLA